MRSGEDRTRRQEPISNGDKPVLLPPFVLLSSPPIERGSIFTLIYISPLSPCHFLASSISHLPLIAPGIVRRIAEEVVSHVFRSDAAMDELLYGNSGCAVSPSLLRCSPLIGFLRT